MKIVPLNDSKFAVDIDFDAGLISDIEWDDDEENVAITYSALDLSAAFEFSISSVLVLVNVTEKNIHADCALFVENTPPSDTLLSEEGIIECAVKLNDKEKIELLVSLLKRSRQK